MSAKGQNMTVRERGELNKPFYNCLTRALPVELSGHDEAVCRLNVSIGGRAGVLGRSGVFIDLPHRLSSLGLYTQSTTRLQN